MAFLFHFENISRFIEIWVLFDRNRSVFVQNEVFQKCSSLLKKNSKILFRKFYVDFPFFTLRSIKIVMTILLNFFSSYLGFLLLLKALGNSKENKSNICQFAFFWFLNVTSAVFCRDVLNWQFSSSLLDGEVNWLIYRWIYFLNWSIFWMKACQFLLNFWKRWRTHLPTPLIFNYITAGFMLCKIFVSIKLNYVELLMHDVKIHFQVQILYEYKPKVFLEYFVQTFPCSNKNLQIYHFVNIIFIKIQYFF